MRETAARVQWYADVLDQGAMRAGAIAVPRGDDDEPIAESPEFEQLTELKRAIEVLLLGLGDEDELPHAITILEDLIDPRFRGFARDGEPISDWVLPPPRARLYLIDEPEQRLHPALQRRAASWLAELMDGWGAQCVLATHAAAFLDVPGDVRVHQVVRGGAAPL